MVTKAAFIRKPDLQNIKMTNMTSIIYFGNIFVSTRKHSVSKLNLKSKMTQRFQNNEKQSMCFLPLGKGQEYLTTLSEKINRMF